MQVNIPDGFVLSMMDVWFNDDLYSITLQNNGYYVYSNNCEYAQFSKIAATLQDAMQVIQELSNYKAISFARCGPSNVDADGREII